MKKNYYFIAPATKAYHGNIALTYESEKKLAVGQVVKITIRNKETIGFVLENAPTPSFKTSPIESEIHQLILPIHQIRLLEWFQEYYPGPLGAIASHFSPEYISRVSKVAEGTQKNELASEPKTALPSLTSEQSHVVNSIKEPGTYLLHGETGTGKTRVYIELIQQQLIKKKSSLILTPEISLTTPMRKQLESVFGAEKILYIHSSLTPKQKAAVWEKLITSTKPYVVVGPRSALFLPITNLGLIVVDESHDQAYKQESSPYYNALRVASKLAGLTKSVLVYGSATPSVNEYFIAKSKKIPILRMVAPAIKSNLLAHDPVIVDMTEDSEKSGKPLISKSLLTEIKRCLDDKSQAILFLNKRGSARVVMCSNCGWRSECERCGLQMTYHQDTHKLQCHTCGRSQATPHQCPECSSTEILFKSPGTKEVHSQLQKLFPEASVARFDKDNKKSESLESKYESLLAGEVDILVGTQLLAKGHDLPNLGLVAALAGDSSLNFPDFTAEEQTYQLIRQLMGRVNRGHREGRFLVQTYNPKSEIINLAINKDWGGFYERQLLQRSSLKFPPFVHAIKIVMSKSNREKTREGLDKIIGELEGRLMVLGPSPCFIEKIGTQYRWQVIVCSTNRNALTSLASRVKGASRIELDPSNFL